MRNRILALTKSLALAAVALAVFAVGQSATRADEVFIAGFTNGCFGAGCAPAASDTEGGLTYNNSSFFGTTAGGFRGLGGNPNPGGNVNNLGSISLSNVPETYNTPFTLQVTFTAPQGINGSNSATFTANITGVVRSDNSGGVFVDFNNNAILFTFNDPNCEADPTGGVPGQQTTCGTGQFFFSVNDTSIDPGQTVSITGQITGAQQTVIPEPATMILLGTGLSAVAAGVRRRRKAAQK